MRKALAEKCKQQVNREFKLAGACRIHYPRGCDASARQNYPRMQMMAKEVANECKLQITIKFKYPMHAQDNLTCSAKCASKEISRRAQGAT